MHPIAHAVPRPTARWSWALWLLFMGFTSLSTAQADIAVVVNANSPILSMTKTQIADLYLGRTRTFPNGDVALIFDHQDRNPLRERFFLALTGLPQQRIDAYWARLTFSGRVLPPRSLTDENAMLEALRKSSAAIGYIRSPHAHDNVRVILVLKE